MNASHRSLWTAYLQLLRLPNVFTAVADVAMGFLVVHQQFAPGVVLACLVLATACLYSAGMVLNDVWDLEHDRKLRPERPLPSGRVSWHVARRLGFALLGMGVASGWAAGYLGMVPDALPWRAGVIATLLGISVWLYDRLLKRTPLGPLTMGACRFFNVLLGMSVAAPVEGAPIWLGFGTHHVMIATGIGIYVAGVTWFASTEAVTSSRWQLAEATFVKSVGIAVLALVYRWLPEGVTPTLSNEKAWFLLLGLIAFTIIRRSSMAVSNPVPQQVQWAVKHSIWSLIVLDASIALLVSAPGWSLIILLLLVPTVVLGRQIQST